MNKCDQTRIRDLCWTIGTSFPPPFQSDRIGLLWITPRLGFLHWNIRRESVLDCEIRTARLLSSGRFVVRIYDVTDIVFDGNNAHSFFDIDVAELSGTYYLNHDRLERNLLAEAGYRMPEGAFVALARSQPVFFDRERPSSRFDTAGLWIHRTKAAVTPVENVFDARIYEELNRARSTLQRPLRIASITLDGMVASSDRPLLALANSLAQKWTELGESARVFTLNHSEINFDPNAGLLTRVAAASTPLAQSIVEEHTKLAFDILHCHDWYSWLVASAASTQLGIPVVATIHSLEIERAGLEPENRISKAIQSWEKKAISGSDLVVVSHVGQRERIVNLFRTPAAKIAVIPHELGSGQKHDEGSSFRQRFGIPSDRPIIAFIGEISHGAGADLLIDSLMQVFVERHDAYCVLVGDGPLKSELQGRAWNAGLGERCKFVGHLNARDCDQLLQTSRFLAIPARSWQDEAIARRAIENGVPVLATHQSRIGCVAHGQNGLLAYDHKGSIVWGLKEMLNNSLGPGMLRFATRRNDSAPSIGLAAASYLTHFLRVHEKRKRGGIHA